MRRGILSDNSPGWAFRAPSRIHKQAKALKPALDVRGHIADAIAQGDWIASRHMLDSQSTSAGCTPPASALGPQWGISNGRSARFLGAHRRLAGRRAMPIGSREVYPFVCDSNY